MEKVKGKRYDIRNIYLPTDFFEVWSKFVKICREEGTSASSMIRKWVEEYVNSHEEG